MKKKKENDVQKALAQILALIKGLPEGTLSVAGIIETDGQAHALAHCDNVAEAGMCLEVIVRTIADETNMSNRQVQDFLKKIYARFKEARENA